MSQPDGDAPARPFLPAMSRDALLPYYDVFTRRARVPSWRKALVVSTSIRPGRR